MGEERLGCVAQLVASAASARPTVPAAPLSASIDQAAVAAAQQASQGWARCAIRASRVGCKMDAGRRSDTTLKFFVEFS
jgi:hypothetical protein